MFKTVCEVHERVVSDYFISGESGEASSLSEVLEAFRHSSVQIVQELKFAQELETRRQLRLLYEGLNIVQSLLAQGVQSPPHQYQNSSTSDVSGPAVRDIRRT